MGAVGAGARALIGSIPNRLQLAGGWIDQPFVSMHDPNPPGSMVVVQIEPDLPPMERSGQAMLPDVVCHPLIKTDLVRLLKAYQEDYPSAMYSGYGGGYLIVASEDPVPGAFHVTVRVAST